MKLVAVSQRVDAVPECQEVRDALDQKLAMFISCAGGLPIPVPNKMPNSYELHVWLSTIKPDAIVLSGGNDIGQCLERDLTESNLLTYAKDHRLPILGICRGMQMIAYWSGVTLKPVLGHLQTRHQLMGAITGCVNSFHRFSLNACPPGFSELARSEDGELEAICHDKLPWEGWMWHPEREPHFVHSDIQRLKKLLNA